jgi:hypothetical protein
MKAINRILFCARQDGGRERGRNICSRLRQSNMQKGAGAGVRTGNEAARRLFTPNNRAIHSVDTD